MDPMHGNIRTAGTPNDFRPGRKTGSHNFIIFITSVAFRPFFLLMAYRRSSDLIGVSPYIWAFLFWVTLDVEKVGVLIEKSVKKFRVVYCPWLLTAKSSDIFLFGKQVNHLKIIYQAVWIQGSWWITKPNFMHSKTRQTNQTLPSSVWRQDWFPPNKWGWHLMIPGDKRSLPGIDVSRYW